MIEYGVCSSGHSKDRHSVRVTAELGDVLLDPSQCQILITQSQVARRLIILHAEESQNAESVVYRNQDDIRAVVALLTTAIMMILGGKKVVWSVKSRRVASRVMCTTVDPDHDRNRLCWLCVQI